MLISDRMLEEIYRLRDEERGVEMIYCSPWTLTQLRHEYAPDFIERGERRFFAGIPVNDRDGLGKLVRFECGVDGFSVVGMYECVLA